MEFLNEQNINDKRTREDRIKFAKNKRNLMWDSDMAFDNPEEFEKNQKELASLYNREKPRKKIVKNIFKDKFEDELDEALNLTEKKKRRKKKQGWFVNYNAGDPEYNADFFNRAIGNTEVNSESNNKGVVEALDKIEIDHDFLNSLNNCIFYQDDKGNYPVIDFIVSQPVKIQSKICYDMGKLNNLGNMARRPLSAHLQDGIYELRTKISSNITRCLYFFIEGNNMVFTNAFTKKQDKTPDSEILLAKKRRNIYLNRKYNYE